MTSPTSGYPLWPWECRAWVPLIATPITTLAAGWEPRGVALVKAGGEPGLSLLDW